MMAAVAVGDRRRHMEAVGAVGSGSWAAGQAGTAGMVAGLDGLVDPGAQVVQEQVDRHWCYVPTGLLRRPVAVVGWHHTMSSGHLLTAVDLV